MLTDLNVSKDCHLKKENLKKIDLKKQNLKIVKQGNSN